MQIVNTPTSTSSSESGDDKVSNEHNRRRVYAVYPPRVAEVEILGYVSDGREASPLTVSLQSLVPLSSLPSRSANLSPAVNGIGYSRDVGRSSVLGGRVFYQFADTFCKNERGEFVGVVSNTCAAVPEIRHPTRSQYLDIESDGRVAPLIRLTDRERQWEADQVDAKGRMTLWGFGGIVEDIEDTAVGWTWYEQGTWDDKVGDAVSVIAARENIIAD